MEKKIANYISVIFHPVFMPTLGLLTILYIGLIPGFNVYVVDQKMDNIYLLFGLLITFTFLIPCSIIYYMAKTGRVSSIRMPYKEERMLPFLLTFISFVTFSMIVLKYIPNKVPPYIIYVVLGATLGVFCAFIVNTFWKISIHMIGIGGFTGMMFTLSYLFHSDFMWVYMSIFLSGLVGFSRMELKAHTIQQVIAGYIVGVLSQVFLVFLIS